MQNCRAHRITEKAFARLASSFGLVFSGVDKILRNTFGLPLHLLLQFRNLSIQHY